jgi:murein DD-endopeptidase MepM/ murein hydrolase activator NlpD
MPSTKKRMRRRRAAPPWQGTVRLGLVFAALIGINVYILLLRGGTSLRALLRTSERGKAGTPIAALVARAPETGAPPATAHRPAARAGSDAADTRVVEGALAAGETVEAALRREGVAVRDAGAIAAALSRVLDATVARAGLGYALAFDGDGSERVRALELRAAPALAWRVERAGEGWRAARDDRPLETRVAEVGGLVVGSLDDTLRRAGESPALATLLADLLAWDLDLAVDAQPGDRFRLVVEKRFVGGRGVRYGRILAAEYQGRAGTVRAFWFRPRDGAPGAYYTEHGEALARGLLKSPLRYALAADRRRPRGTTADERGRLGVDHPARAGAPVWAVATGRVVALAAGAVILAHPDGAESSYLHLQRAARGLAVGQTVRQRQVIGYAATPHVRFCLKRDGTFVDPSRVRAAREAPLPDRYRGEFADAVAPRLAALAAIVARAPGSAD